MIDEFRERATTRGGDFAKRGGEGKLVSYGLWWLVGVGLNLGCIATDVVLGNHSGGRATTASGVEGYLAQRGHFDIFGIGYFDVFRIFDYFKGIYLRKFKHQQSSTSRIKR